MDRATQGGLLLALGGVALRLGLTDASLAYVKPGLRPLLTATAVVLIALSVPALSSALRGQRRTDDLGGHGHGGEHGPGVAWLLLLPLLSLLLVAPPPLGAYAASRQSTPVVDTTVGTGPLPPEERGAVPLRLGQFLMLGTYDPGRSLEGVRVRLTGFVSEVQAGEGYTLSRFTVGCCAADARPVSIAVADDQAPPPPLDQWLEVEGVWRPREIVELGEVADGPPVLEAAQRTAIQAPAQPYDY